MTDDETERLKKVRDQVARLGYLVRTNTSKFAKILGKDFQFVDRESLDVIAEGRLGRMEHIAHDLCRKKTG